MKTKYHFLSMLLLSTLALSLFSDSIVAQVKVTEMDWSGKEAEPEIIEMTVSPAPQASPIFEHRLTLLPDETVAGNAATMYMHSLGENSLRGTWKRITEQFGDEVESWGYYDTPESEAPIEKHRQASAMFDDYIKQHIARASKRRDCDWGLGLEELKGPMVIGLRLNGLQETRSISRAIALQTRLAIRESRFDDAFDLMRMNYRLGQNVGRVKLLIGSLIGIAEVGIANGNMVDFIAAPDSPNMYWALSELPRPLIDVRGAMRLECGMALRIFPEMGSAEEAEHSHEEWSRIVQNIPRAAMEVQSLEDIELPRGIEFLPAAFGIMSYSPAKERLIESGMDAEAVEKMAVGQVLLVDAKREYQRIADAMEVVAYIPFSEAIKKSAEIENWLKAEESTALSSFGSTIAIMILPAVQQVVSAQVRTQRDIDALRVIEALRMHAAETGKFPKSLDDVTVVRVPRNPATDKPFDYRLDGETAILELPFSDGNNYWKRYKISLR